jgi:hypothetical protein
MPIEENQEEKPGIFQRIKNIFGSGDDDTQYDRHIMDRRIERYLDGNFDNYIDEYGLVRELDLRKYDERYEDLVENVDGLRKFVKDADADIGNLEKRTDDLKNIVGKSGKK